MGLLSMKGEIDLAMQLIFEKLKSKFGDAKNAAKAITIVIHIDGYSWHEDKFSGVIGILSKREAHISI